MNSESLYFGIVIIGLVWLFVSFLTTRELINYPLLTQGKKIIFLLVLWGLPFIGAFIVHKVIGLGWAKGDTSGGDGQVLPPD